MLVESRVRPMVFGHRGASAHAPDNTIDAFRIAAQSGADGVELDVRFTADGHIVVHHDPALSDFGLFTQRTFADLRAAAPQIPTLEEAEEVLDGLMINVEIKNDPRQPDFDTTDRMADAIARWVAAGDRYHRVIVSSFNPGTVDRVRELDAAITTGQLVGPVAQPWDEIRSAADRGHRWIILAKRHFRRRSAEFVADAHGAELLVAVWTVDAPRTLRRLDEDGVDAVITNDPGRALEIYSPG